MKKKIITFTLCAVLLISVTVLLLLVMEKNGYLYRLASRFEKEPSSTEEPQGIGNQTPLEKELQDPDTEAKKAYVEARKRKYVYLSPGASWMLPRDDHTTNEWYDFVELKLAFQKAVVTKDRSLLEREGVEFFYSDIAKIDLETQSYYVAYLSITIPEEKDVDIGGVNSFHIYSYKIYGFYNDAGNFCQTNTWEMVGYNPGTACEKDVIQKKSTDKSYFIVDPLKAGLTYDFILVYIVPDVMLGEDNSFYISRGEVPPASLNKDIPIGEVGRAKYLYPVLIIGEQGEVVATEGYMGEYFPVYGDEQNIIYAPS